MKGGIIIQARVDSTRLRGKNLLPLMGEPMLYRLVERLRLLENISLIVATTTNSEDDAIVKVCEQYQISFFRGSSEDVLERYRMAADQFELNSIARVTADCPLIDPVIVQNAMNLFSTGKYDYVSNVRCRTFPRGLDCEIFTNELLNRAVRERIPQDVPEWVVIPYVERKKNELRIGSYEDRENHSDLRWTVDERADYEFVEQIYGALYPKKKIFLYRDVLQLLEEQPGLKKINAHVKQKST